MTAFPAQQRGASSTVGDGPTVAWEIAANTSYRAEPKLKSRPFLEETYLFSVLGRPAYTISV